MNKENYKGKNPSMNRKIVLFLIILILFTGLFLFNLFRINKDVSYKEEKLKKNIETLASYDFSDVASVEDALNQNDGSSGISEFQKEVNKYNKLFKNSVIVGDSLTEGISAYGYLGEDRVFSKIGGSIMKNGDMFDLAAKTYPKYAFFSFGMNDIGMFSGDYDKFIEEYTSLLKKFQKTSPKTKIYINSISTPSDTAISNEPILKNYKDFNKAIKKMCKKMKLEYIDTTQLFKEHPDLYAGDGIHANPSYYPLWLDLMIKKAGIK